ncbi:MAG: hypothetical protein WAV40_00860 [Microgenomates group bacterium]
MTPTWVKENSKQARLFEAIFSSGQLGDLELRKLGFDPLFDLASLRFMVCKINKKISPDKIINIQNGSTAVRGGLNPVLIYQRAANADSTK